MAPLWVAEARAFRHPLARVVGVAVDLEAAAGDVVEAAEESRVVLDGRVAPDLRRVGDLGVAGGDESGGGPPHAAVRRVGVAEAVRDER